MESAPPVVVKTVPEAGGADVDSTLGEIKVRFSKEMQDDSWSWIAPSKDNFPKLTGKPRYLADKRTCVLPVKLEPGKTYGIWLNRGKLGNFKDTDGQPLVDKILVSAGMSSGLARPIVRAVAGHCEALGCNRDMIGQATYAVIGVVDFGRTVAVQFKSPTWTPGRKSGTYAERLSEALSI